MVTQLYAPYVLGWVVVLRIVRIEGITATPLFLDHRPRPGRPRTVKISKTRYPVDRKAAPLK
ncbi:hypothetical protein DQ403_19560 [Stutzerimonas zhaodongensis]|uniref:Uncharacterized protein n=1 Tax=Stutzerimonas zhaodongensis TaxID=1176257 RepID=A0A365PQ44_9GAMM|nr:hypothetical protein DQ403_19560 [Stutzerimonas zhaodongensis]